MIKLAHKNEAISISNLPAEVAAIVVEIAIILDENYANARNIEHDLGGYILLAESLEDVQTIKEIIDFQYTLPEYVEAITAITISSRSYINVSKLWYNYFKRIL